MLNLWRRLFTKNNKEIPLLWITFNLNHYKNKGKENSCTLKIHPVLRNDEHIKERLNDLVDYIRSNCNMEDM